MTTTITYHCGDVRDVMQTMADSSVDLLVTSPPFLALRSYLSADHPDKHREIGSEPTPAAFLDTMLALTAEWRRLVTPTGSICVEIGDTYSGSGGAGGDYAEDGMRAGAPKFDGSANRNRTATGWPLPKSLCGIPTLYAWSLAYGTNLLTGQPSPAGQWRVRNLLHWTRPNPPVGALGDKFRPATSHVTVACVSDRRWFDLDAVRGEYKKPEAIGKRLGKYEDVSYDAGAQYTWTNKPGFIVEDRGGAPPLDWWDATNDWQPLHQLPTQPYAGAHYATFPVALPQRLIQAMCPLEVCAVCGDARRRIVEPSQKLGYSVRGDDVDGANGSQTRKSLTGNAYIRATGLTYTQNVTLGWSDCGHGDYHPGVVLDPFGGSGTTALAAALCGRNAILIDLDHRNVELARHRIGESVQILAERVDGDTTTWTVSAELPGLKREHPDQLSLFWPGD